MNLANSVTIDHDTEAPADNAELRKVLNDVIDALGDQQSPLKRRLAETTAIDMELTPRHRCIVLDATDEDILREEGGFVLTVVWAPIDLMQV